MLSSTDFEDVEAFERLVTAYSPMERFDFAASQNFAVQLDEYIQDLAWRHGATLKSLGLSPHFLNAEMLVAALSVHPTLLTELSLRVRRDCVVCYFMAPLFSVPCVTVLAGENSICGCICVILGGIAYERRCGRRLRDQSVPEQCSSNTEARRK
jgi:hypothetical protein